MTHGHELGGRNAGGRGCKVERNKGEKKWDNCKSTINKIYSKKLIKHKKYKYTDINLNSIVTYLDMALLNLKTRKDLLFIYS